MKRRGLLALAALSVVAIGCDNLEQKATTTDPLRVIPEGTQKIFDAQDGTKVWRFCDGVDAIYILREGTEGRSIFALKGGCLR